jgi:hypothetical protein
MNISITSTHFSRAAEANQTEIVRLIFDIKVGDDLLDLFLVCDKNGQNVFHYAVKNPTVLDCLLSKFVSVIFKFAFHIVHGTQ